MQSNQEIKVSQALSRFVSKGARANNKVNRFKKPGKRKNATESYNQTNYSGDYTMWLSCTLQKFLLFFSPFPGALSFPSPAPLSPDVMEWRPLKCDATRRKMANSRFKFVLRWLLLRCIHGTMAILILLLRFSYFCLLNAHTKCLRSALTLPGHLRTSSSTATCAQFGANISMHYYEKLYAQSCQAILPENGGYDGFLCLSL